MSISTQNTPGTSTDKAYSADPQQTTQAYGVPSVKEVYNQQQTQLPDAPARPDTVYGSVTCKPEEVENKGYSSYTMSYSISPDLPKRLRDFMTQTIDRFATSGSTMLFNAFEKHGLKPKDITLSFTDNGLKYSFSGFNTKTMDVVDLVQRTMEEINIMNKMEQNEQNTNWMNLLRQNN